MREEEQQLITNMPLSIITKEQIPSKLDKQ